MNMSFSFSNLQNIFYPPNQNQQNPKSDSVIDKGGATLRSPKKEGKKCGALFSSMMVKAMILGILGSIGYSLFNTYSSTSPLQDRNFLVCNPATFFDPGLQKFQGESFVDKIHSIGLKNLTPIPLLTDSGALWLQDSEKNPMGIFKYGNGQEADHIVHQIVNTSGGLLKTPSIFKTSWINDSGYSTPGNLLEYVPHLEGDGYFVYSSHNFAKFEKVSTESLQSKAFLDLLIDNRDSHMGNVMVSPNYEVITIDHDHSLLNDNFQDIAELIRKNESFTSRSGVSNVPFWMQRQLADRIKSPISTKLACWIESLDLKKCCNKVEKKVWIHLNARLTFIKIALRNGRHLTDLYDYLTSRRYIVEGTIYQDYVKAMRLTAESFHDLQNTSDDDLYATFLHHFLELTTIRMAA